MSHLTQINTQVRNLNLVRQALADLGIHEKEDVKKVKFYYGSPVAADFVFGPSEGDYDCGFRAKADGNFEFLADYWGLDCSTSGQQLLDAIGCQRNTENGNQGKGTHWRWMNEGVAGSANRGGHVGISGPCKLLQGYIGKAVELAAKYEGRTKTSIPLDNGDIRHELRGGDLGRSVVVVTAKSDGTCVIHVELGDGPSCKQKTKLLEEILGQVTSEVPTAEFYHQRNAAGQMEHVKW